MTADTKPAAPFSFWERSVALRYLRARRKDGGVALISTISFILIMLAVAILIIVMSVMNGFRSELLDRILGFNGHLHVTGAVMDEPERDMRPAAHPRHPRRRPGRAAWSRPRRWCRGAGRRPARSCAA